MLCFCVCVGQAPQNPYVRTLTINAHGLEEPWNFQELLTKSVGPVHFS